MIVVEPGDPKQPLVTHLLHQSHALMESLFPIEDNHYLDIDRLTADDIHFFVARIRDKPVGTGALMLDADYGEIKSMFVADEARNRGVADAILRQLEDCARTLGVRCLKLETGDMLHAAQRLYERHGFEICEAFGDYLDGGSSVFMQKTLAPQAQ